MNLLRCILCLFVVLFSLATVEAAPRRVCGPNGCTIVDDAPAASQPRGHKPARMRGRCRGNCGCGCGLFRRFRCLFGRCCR